MFCRTILLVSDYSVNITTKGRNIRTNEIQFMAKGWLKVMPPQLAPQVGAWNIHPVNVKVIPKKVSVFSLTPNGK